MSALLQRQEAIRADRFTADIERWLSGDPSVNLACDMYIRDHSDDRWRQGHSSKHYYVKSDERATADLAFSNLDIVADNLFEMGVGGGEAVHSNTVRMARKVGAKNVFALDLSLDLANNAVNIVEKELGIRGIPVLCDMFQALPIAKSNTIISVLGLEIGNLETYDNPEDVQDRLTQIFSHYARAVTSRCASVQSHLLISYDANRNLRETKACYDNREFGGLVRSLIERALGDTSHLFDYEVVTRKTPDIDFLSTGLRSKHDQIVPFNGEMYPIKEGQFLPVLNSSRFSIPFMTKAVEQAGWKHKNIWSATGRVQYQHFAIG